MTSFTPTMENSKSEGVSNKKCPQVKSKNANYKMFVCEKTLRKCNNRGQLVVSNRSVQYACRNKLHVLSFNHYP